MPSQRLTDKFLKGLKPAASGQVDYWDKLLPGFGVRVGTSGRKSFFVWTRINGKPKRITIKPPYMEDSDLARARNQARAIIADAHAGIGPELRKKREAKGTFGAVAESFMQDYAKNHRTRDEMQRIINRYLAEWHDRQINDITRGDIKELLRVKARTAPIMANRMKALISKIFTWAVKEEIIEASPALSLDPPGGSENERTRTLSADEIHLVWKSFGKLGYPWGPVFKMLLVTGQRCGEVGGIKWSEIADDGWHIPNERAKSGRGHLVPLSSLAKEILAEVPQIGELVFRTRLGSWSWAKERVDAKIPHWRLHDLRRTFATHLRTIGIDRLVVSKLLNHAEGGVTKIYDRYAADPEKTAAMERWANRLRDIIGGAPADNVVQIKSA